jgi:hypothetical protein
VTEQLIQNQLFDRSVREFIRLKEIRILQKRVWRSVDVLRSLKETGKMALFLLVTRAGLTTNQSTLPLFLSFWALPCGRCMPDFDCRLFQKPTQSKEGVLAHSALRLMTHLVHVLPGYFSMRYREVTSNVDTIDIFDSTNKYEAGIGIKHMPEFIWVNHNHVS